MTELTPDLGGSETAVEIDTAIVAVDPGLALAGLASPARDRPVTPVTLGLPPRPEERA